MALSLHHLGRNPLSLHLPLPMISPPLHLPLLISKGSIDRQITRKSKDYGRICILNNEITINLCPLRSLISRIVSLSCFRSRNPSNLSTGFKNTVANDGTPYAEEVVVPEADNGSTSEPNQVQVLGNSKCWGVEIGHGASEAEDL